MKPYEPIDCSLHDRYEAASVLRQRVEVGWHDGDTRCVQTGLIADIVARDGIEYMVLGDTTHIRLDVIDSFRLIDD